MTQQYSVGVRSNAKECSVSEADKAGIAHKQHQTDTGDAVYEYQCHFAEVERAEYEWRKNQRYYLGDSVQRDIVLRIRDLEQYSQLVKQLTRLPLHQLHPPQLGHSKLEQLRLQALRAALVQGQLKARTIAESIDAELGPVIYVEEHSSSSPAPQRMMMESAAAGGDSAFSLAKQRISAQVEIRYSLF